jgi:hypothetical protein
MDTHMHLMGTCKVDTVVVVVLVAGGIDPVAGSSLAVAVDRGTQTLLLSLLLAVEATRMSSQAVALTFFVGRLRHLYPCPTLGLRHHCSTRASSATSTSSFHHRYHPKLHRRTSIDESSVATAEMRVSLASSVVAPAVDAIVAVASCTWHDPCWSTVFLVPQQTLEERQDGAVLSLQFQQAVRQADGPYFATTTTTTD